MVVSSRDSPHVHPDDGVLRIPAQHLLHQRQVPCPLVVAAEVGMDGERNAAVPQQLHEGGPLRDGGRRHRLVPVVEQGLLDQVDLTHPAEEGGVLRIEELHPGQDRAGVRQIREGHRQRQMETLRRLHNHVRGVDEIILQRRRHRGAGTVEIVGAGGRRRQHLADAVHVGEQDGGRLEVLDNLVERDGRSAERPEVDVRVDDGGLELHGSVVAGRVSHPEGVQRQRLRLGGRHRRSRPAGVRRTALG